MEPAVEADGDLFEFEFGPISEMSRFLSWEIMHLQTITDVVNDLKQIIIADEFKSTASIKATLEKLLTP